MQYRSHPLLDFPRLKKLKFQSIICHFRSTVLRSCVLKIMRATKTFENWFRRRMRRIFIEVVSIRQCMQLCWRYGLIMSPLDDKIAASSWPEWSGKASPWTCYRSTKLQQFSSWQPTWQIWLTRAILDKQEAPAPRRWWNLRVFHLHFCHFRFDKENLEIKNKRQINFHLKLIARVAESWISQKLVYVVYICCISCYVFCVAAPGNRMTRASHHRYIAILSVVSKFRQLSRKEFRGHVTLAPLRRSCNNALSR